MAREKGGKGAALVLVAVYAVGTGCGTSFDDYYDCGDGYGEGCPPTTGSPPPECPGPCIPAGPVGWSSPLLLWIGPVGSDPPCPDAAPVLGYEGNAGFSGAPEQACPTCSCETPSITCELPAKWTTSDAACSENGPVEVHLEFDAPEGWDGSCTTENAIPAGVSCASGNCVSSLSVEPPVAKSGQCTPKAEEPSGLQDVKWTWSVEGRVCMLGSYPPCPEAVDACAPPEAEGFLTCIYREGERECPPEWPVTQVLYEGVDDTRGCTECACGDIEGAACTIVTTAYGDAGCSMVAASYAMSSEHEGGYCSDVIMPGVPLGSKSASVTSLEPGSCKPSGGEPIGAATPSRPSTFCCRG